MMAELVSKIMSLICDGWSWWWDGYTEDNVTRAVVSLLVAILAVSWYVWVSKKLRKGKPPLPPGPPGLPLVGNLPFVEADLHRYFAKLAEVYGPIVKLRLGSKLCVVLSSPSLAKEVLRDHDATFANRNPPVAGLAFSYGGNDILWSSNGPSWRMMRGLFVREMMSNTNLNACSYLRQREVGKLVKDVYAKMGTPINIGEQMYLTMLNLIMSMLWGGVLEGEERTSIGLQFRQVIGEMVDLAAEPNVSDFFPFLARFDIQGIERKANKLWSRFNHIIDSVISRRMNMNGANDNEESKDFLQFLLELKQRGDAKTPLTMAQLKALLLDFLSGGSDTLSTTTEWAMAEMMQHPEVMRKAQEELQEVVGRNNMVEESHLSKLPYLHALMKETLRLHPVLPLLVPHCPTISCTVGGYTVPKGATVFLNVWALHRDPVAWDNPLEFRPERFLSETERFDYMGNNFNYLPFGSGRRICAGIPLAERMLKYVLASLLHSFHWRLPEQVKFDLSEKFGIVMKKTTPLVAIPTPRLPNVTELDFTVDSIIKSSAKDLLLSAFVDHSRS